MSDELAKRRRSNAARMRTRTVPSAHPDLYAEAARIILEIEAEDRANLQNGDKDWETPCLNCKAVPTMHPTQLCGPCCTGEAETAGGNW